MASITQPQATPSQTTGASAADWQRALTAWVASHKIYPEAARRDDTQGSVLLRFTVDRSGHVGAVEVVQSSGSPVLDTAAQNLLRNATLPPLPAAIPQASLTISMRIRYALTE